MRTQLCSPDEYVFEPRDLARGWTHAGKSGLVAAQIPSWIRDCRRHYARERAAGHEIDLGGESG